MAIAEKFSHQLSDPALEGVVAAPGPTSEPRRFRSWQWLLIGFNLCISAGAIAVGCMLWLISLPPAPNCQQLSAIATDSERLYCAQQAAKSGRSDDLIAALNLVEPWRESHPLYLQKQQQLEQWSEAILELAYQQAYDSDLDNAIDLAQRIPSSSLIYEQAQSTIQKWRTEWHRGEEIYAEAQTALQVKDWNMAQAQVKRLYEFSHPHWRSHQAQTLAQQIAIEREAHTLATQAQGLAASGTAQDIQHAIIKARTLDQTTYSWQALQPELKQWHNMLLQQGLALWYEGNLKQATHLADIVADDPEFSAEANHLKVLSQARTRAVLSTPNWEPSVTHLWHLAQAIQSAEQIKPESQFYPQAVSSIESWKQQLVDLKQLHYAQLAAYSRTQSGYRYAIEQARGIAADRPRRIQAQTLIAHWQREIERLEDRPHLLAAKQLAALGQVADLRNAIARAQQVAPGRALHGEAQSLIYRWRSEIQTIEDRPTLAQARRLANQGNLQDAIATASRIGAGRSLHSQAQSLIQRWRNELRERQRQLTILNEPPDHDKDATDFVHPSPNEDFPPEFSPMMLPDSQVPAPELQGQQESEPADVPQPSVTPAQPELESPQPTVSDAEAERSLPPSHNNLIPDIPSITPMPIIEPGTGAPSLPESSSDMPPPQHQTTEETVIPTPQGHQPFDLHSELSREQFPLLFAGSLFVGI